MKKLLAILIFTLMSSPANSAELEVKERRISPTTIHQCVSNSREFASGELIVEFFGKPKHPIHHVLRHAFRHGAQPLIKTLFDNWYQISSYWDCNATKQVYEDIKNLEGVGVKRVEYNYIMRAMPN